MHKIIIIILIIIMLTFDIQSNFLCLILDQLNVKISTNVHCSIKSMVITFLKSV